MRLGLPLKSLALRFLPEAVLQHVRRAHYTRKLKTAAPEPEMAVLRHLIQPGGCALDLGANFGLYTRFLAEAVGPDGVVHAVEPVPPMYDVLRSNVRRLRLRQVRTHPVAVSDVTRTVTMTVPRYATGGSNFYEARVVRTPPARAGKIVRLPGIRLDDLFARLPRIDVVKCDVEGHELSVLRGAETLLQRHRPAWLMEVSGDPDDAASDAGGVVELMRAAGYEVYQLDGRLRPRQAGDRAVNYFFLRPEHLVRLPADLTPTTTGRPVLV